MVNENFRTWFRTVASQRFAKDFQDLCSKLGITEASCLRQATDAFEHFKTQFTVPEDPWTLIINGVQGAELSSANPILTR